MEPGGAGVAVPPSATEDCFFDLQPVVRTAVETTRQARIANAKMPNRDSRRKAAATRLDAIQSGIRMVPPEGYTPFYARFFYCTRVNSRTQRIASGSGKLTLPFDAVSWGVWKFFLMNFPAQRNYRYSLSWGLKCVRKISYTKEKQFCRDYFPQEKDRLQQLSYTSMCGSRGSLPGMPLCARKRWS